jgi:hypothetical protein
VRGFSVIRVPVECSFKSLDPLPNAYVKREADRLFKQILTCETEIPLKSIPLAPSLVVITIKLSFIKFLRLYSVKAYCF